CWDLGPRLATATWSSPVRCRRVLARADRPTLRHRPSGLRTEQLASGLGVVTAGFQSSFAALELEPERCAVFSGFGLLALRPRTLSGSSGSVGFDHEFPDRLRGDESEAFLHRLGALCRPPAAGKGASGSDACGVPQCRCWPVCRCVCLAMRGAGARHHALVFVQVGPHQPQGVDCSLRSLFELEASYAHPATQRHLQPGGQCGCPGPSPVDFLALGHAAPQPSPRTTYRVRYQVTASTGHCDTG
ncbi:mycE, partial [Symbiodinium sp. CCMP2456]